MSRFATTGLAACVLAAVVAAPAESQYFVTAAVKTHHPEVGDRLATTQELHLVLPASTLQLPRRWLCTSAGYSEGTLSSTGVSVTAEILGSLESKDPTTLETVVIKGKVENNRGWRECKEIRTSLTEDVLIRVTFDFKRSPVFQASGSYWLQAWVGSDPPQLIDHWRGFPSWSLGSRYEEWVDPPPAHLREHVSTFFIDQSMPDGGELCSRYSRYREQPEPDRGRVKVKYEVYRGGSKPVEKGKLRSANVRAGKTKLVCGETGRLRKGDVLLVRHIFAKMPRVIIWEVDALLSPARKTDSRIDLISVRPPFGSSIIPGTSGNLGTVTVAVTGYCDVPDGCVVQARATTSDPEVSIWSGTGGRVPAGEFYHESLIRRCDAGETSGGIKVEMRRMSDDALLAERFVRGEYKCE